MCLRNDSQLPVKNSYRRCLGSKYCMSTLYLYKFKYKILVIFVSILRNRVHGSIKIVNRSKNCEWSDKSVSSVSSHSKWGSHQTSGIIFCFSICLCIAFLWWQQPSLVLSESSSRFKLSENLDIKGTFSATKRILMKSKKSIKFWLAVFGLTLCGVAHYEMK